MKDQELKDEVMRQYLKMFDRYARDKKFLAGRRYELERIYLHSQLVPKDASYRTFYQKVETDFLRDECSELEKKAKKWVKK